MTPSWCSPAGRHIRANWHGLTALQVQVNSKAGTVILDSGGGTLRVAINPLAHLRLRVLGAAGVSSTTGGAREG